jgi:hypothetical protein
MAGMGAAIGPAFALIGLVHSLVSCYRRTSMLTLHPTGTGSSAMHLPDRRRVLVSLVTPGMPGGVTTRSLRSDRTALAQRNAQEAKTAFKAWLENFREEDPDLRYRSKEDLFPIVVVETTDGVIEKIKTSHLVRSVEDDWSAGIVV